MGEVLAMLAMACLAIIILLSSIYYFYKCVQAALEADDSSTKSYPTEVLSRS